MTAAHRHTTRRWLTRLLVVGLMLGLAVVAAPAGSSVRAVAQEAPLGQDAITAVVGYDNILPNASHLPLEVTLAPDVPIRGRLVVATETNGGQRVERRDIEVGAGGQKVFRFLVPTGFGVGVQFIADGSDTATTVRPQVPFSSSAIVAGLGNERQGALPAGLSLPVVQRSVDRVGYDPAWLALGPATLSGIGTLVTSQSDLSALSPEQRRTIDHAIVEGLQVIVTEVAAPDLGLAVSPILDISFTPAPTAWTVDSVALTRVTATTDAIDDGTGSGQPTPPNVARITQGRGEIVAMTGRADDAAVLGASLRQRDALQRVRQNELPLLQNRVVGQALSGGLAGLPPIWALALVMGLYILLVGPLNALILRMVGRIEFAWVTVPAITLLFVLGAAGFARGSGASNGTQQQAAVWLDGAGTEVTTLSVSSSARGILDTILAGTDWTVDSLGFVGGIVVERAGDRVAATIPVATRESAGLVARRPIETDAPLDVEAAILEGVLRLEVTNTLTVPVSEVLVRVAGFDQRLAGRLEPGETITEVLDLPAAMPQVPSIDGLLNQLQNQQFEGDIRVPFPQPQIDRGFGFDVDAGQIRPIDNGVVSTPARQTFIDFGVLAEVDPLPGVVWIVADVDPDAIDLAPASIAGRTATQDVAVIAVGVTPSTTDTDTSPYETPMRVLDDNEGIGMSTAPTRIFGNGTVMLAFDLPREADLDGLSLSDAVKGDAFQDNVEFGFGFDGGFQGGPIEMTAEPFPGGAAPGDGFAVAQASEFCVSGQERGADGNVTGEFQECGTEDPIFACPPDAVSCVVTGDSSSVCFADGRCVERFRIPADGPTLVPLPPDKVAPPGPPFGPRVEVWDPFTQSWATLDDPILTPQYADPFGRVLIRLLDTFEVDLSGRGVGAALTNGAQP